MSTRFMRLCGALAAVVLAVTASDQQWPAHQASGPVSAAPGLATAVRPASGSSPRHAPAKPDCDPQNPRPSLRPQGPLPAPGQMPAGSTMAAIAQRGHLIASVDQDTHQFAFRDENLRLTGFDIDIVRDIAEAIFGDREKVVFLPRNVADRFTIVNARQADLAVATATITCARRAQVDFSTVYYEARQRLLVNHGSAVHDLGGLAGKRVCGASGSTSLEKIQTTSLKPIPVGVPATTDCLMLLQLGEVDAVSTDDTLLFGMKAQDPRTEVIGPQLEAEPYGVAISKDTPDLVRFVNAVLARRVQDGRWRASYEHWLMPLLGPPPSPPVPQYRD